MGEKNRRLDAEEEAAVVDAQRLIAFLDVMSRQKFWSDTVTYTRYSGKALLDLGIAYTRGSLWMLPEEEAEATDQ